MAATRIDFKFVKAQADFLVVLKHYNIEVFGSGVSRSIRCPFHQEKKPSCKINLGRKIFHCFGCEAQGNVLEFVRRKEGLEENDLRAAARKLASICDIPLAPPKDRASRPASEGATEPVDARSDTETIKDTSSPPSLAAEAPAQPEGHSDSAMENAPLDPAFVERFEGKLLREHPYFAARGLTDELVEYFGLGYFPAEAKGMMRNRLCFPLHDAAGQLLAYCGRWAGSDADLPAGEEKYKLPKGFHKSQVLFNLHRVSGRRHLVVVEGCFSVFRLHAIGVPTIALLGRSLSQEQITLLHSVGVQYITFLLDGDEAGRSAACAMMEQLSREPFRVKFALLPDGSQPDTVDEPILRELLGLR